MDEGGDVGPVASVAESSTVTVTVPSGDETLMENPDCEGEVEGSYDEGDEEEIMVEVVGSDVFVDGVSGEGDCDGLGKEGLGGGTDSFGGGGGVVGGVIGSGEVGNFGGQVWDSRAETGIEEEIPAVADERAGLAVEMEGVEVAPVSTSEDAFVVAPRVELSVSQKAEEKGLVDKKVLGISEVVDGGKGEFDNSSKGGVLDDEVWNPGIDAEAAASPLRPETDDAQQEVVGEESAVMVQEKDSNCKDEIPGVADQSPVVETVSEACDRDSASQASAELSNHLVEAVATENVHVPSTEESLQSKGAGLETNIADQDSHSSGEGQPMKDNQDVDTNVSHEIQDRDSLSSFKPHNDAFGGEVAGVEGKISSSPNREVLHDVKFDSSYGGCREVGASSDTGIQLSSVGEVLAADGNGASEKSVSDIILGTERQYPCGQTQVVKQEEVLGGNSNNLSVEPEVCDGHENEKRSYSEELLTMNQEASHGNDFYTHAAPEASHDHSSLVERAEWIGMDIDEVLDFKDEATGLDTSAGNLSFSGNTEDFSGEHMRSFNQVDTATKFPMTDIEDKEPVQSDLGIFEENKQVATGNTELIAEKEAPNVKGEVSDGDASLQHNEKFEGLDVGGGAAKTEGVIEANAVSSSEQVGAVACMEFSVVSQEAVNMEDNDVLLNKSADGADIGMPLASDGGADSSSPNKKQDEVGQNEMLVHEVDDLDRLSDEGAYNDPISDVKDSTGVQTVVDSTCSLGDGDIASLSSSGNENANMLDVTKEASTSERDQTAGNSVCEFSSSHGSVDHVIEREDECCKANNNQFSQAVTPETQSIEGQHGEPADNKEQYMVIQEHTSGMDHSKISGEKPMTPSSPSKVYQSGYLIAPENEGEFFVSDLVWGKVRSHPWWPGQIFDPSHASDKAVKYYKKDSFLVAYFGDRTFAWNDASVLKPFRSYFSQIERQSNSEAFQNAVSSALDEVSRRVELGLSCSCIPTDAYESIECQIVENTGVREESSRRYGVDKSTEATSFEPDKLLEHVKVLAQSPLSVVDRLELVLSKAQVSAFCRFKGYRPPPALEPREASLENDAGTLKLNDELDHTVSVTMDGEEVPLGTSSSHKRKQNSKDSLQPKKKERSLSELMGDMVYSPDDEDDVDGKASSKSVSALSVKKRKAVDSTPDGSDRRISIYAAKVSTTSSPKPSFKVGDCIRRVASQLTGSASILKVNNDQSGGDTSLHINDNSQRGNMTFPADISLEEMLSQLQLAARDPKKGYSFLNNIIIFFSVFRKSIIRKHAPGRSGGGRMRKASHAAGGSTEEFEFDDVNDSYWRDRIVHNYSEELLLQNGENGDGEYPLIASDPDKLPKPSRRSYSRKQYSNGNYEASADEPTEDVERMNRDLSPAELILSFAEGDRLPSEVILNKMFRRFGPLKESETEVDWDSHRARVIFKRGADAEVAYSSAGRFNIFGSMLVSYQLSYSPPTTSRALPLLITQGQEDAT